MERPHFRFEDLEIWRLAQELAIRFYHVADDLEQRKLFRFAEQIRAGGLSVPNNIAEGSGSLHAKEFQQFLNIARRSVFENVSMILTFEAMSLLKSCEADELLWKCDELSRKIINYARSTHA
jgi:four helix bundle protein